MQIAQIQPIQPIQPIQQQPFSVMITYPLSDLPLNQFINKVNPEIKILNINVSNKSKYQYQVFVATNEEVMMLLCLNHLSNHEIFARKFVQFKVVQCQPHNFFQLQHYIFTNYKIFHCDLKTRTLNLEYFLSKIGTIAQQENIQLPQNNFNPYQLLLDCLQYFKEEVPDLISIKLNNNNLKDSKIIRDIANNFPLLKSLDISNNDFSNYPDLASLLKTSIVELNIERNIGYEEGFVRNMFLLKNKTLKVLNNKPIRMSMLPTETNPTREIILKPSLILPKQFNHYKRCNEFFVFFARMHKTNLQDLIKCYKPDCILTTTFDESIPKGPCKSRNLKSMDIEEDPKTGIYVGPNDVGYAIGFLYPMEFDVKNMSYDFIPLTADKMLYSVTIIGNVRIQNVEYHMCRSLIVNFIQDKGCCISNDHIHLTVCNEKNTPCFSSVYRRYLSDVNHLSPNFSRLQSMFMMDCRGWNWMECLMQMNNPQQNQ